jgi:hypothetical protein
MPKMSLLMIPLMKAVKMKKLRKTLLQPRNNNNQLLKHKASKPRRLSPVMKTLMILMTVMMYKFLPKERMFNKRSLHLPLLNRQKRMIVVMKIVMKILLKMKRTRRKPKPRKLDQARTLNKVQESKVKSRRLLQVRMMKR